jgi:protein-S-isoprenylcysteine O-methyltransferase Ste14
VELNFLQLAVLILSWLIYFAVHSVLASMAVKKWFSNNLPEYFHVYRLAYNLLAMILLIIPVWLSIAWRSDLIIQWQGAAEIVSYVLTLFALAGFVASATIYDGAHFIGFSQFREKDRAVIDQEQFKISWMHRYVRHPWYFLGLVFIWSRDMDIHQLIGTVLITLYLIVGSKLEEKKLIINYGEAYRNYCNRVAGLVPLPWKTLQRNEVDDLFG